MENCFSMQLLRKMNEYSTFVQSFLSKKYGAAIKRSHLDLNLKTILLKLKVT